MSFVLLGILTSMLGVWLVFSGTVSNDVVVLFGIILSRQVVQVAGLISALFGLVILLLTLGRSPS
jgi:hypothetical protein